MKLTTMPRLTSESAAQYNKIGQEQNHFPSQSTRGKAINVIWIQNIFGQYLIENWIHSDWYCITEVENFMCTLSSR
jgi:hypothetical protein